MRVSRRRRHMTALQSHSSASYALFTCWTTLSMYFRVPTNRLIGKTESVAFGTLGTSANAYFESSSRLVRGCRRHPSFPALTVPRCSLRLSAKRDAFCLGCPACSNSEQISRGASPFVGSSRPAHQSRAIARSTVLSLVSSIRSRKSVAVIGSPHILYEEAFSFHDVQSLVQKQFASLTALDISAGLSTT